MKTTRTYEMQARARQVDRTRARVMAATMATVNEKPLLAVTLPDVAARSGVSVQTILRQFGSRDGLLDATTEYATEQVVAERRSTPGDVGEALRVLVAHYEERGDGVMLLLGQESWEPRAAQVTSRGRTLHRAWVEEVFGPLLPEARDSRAELVELLVVATDVYTWKLLRRDRGLSREVTTQRMRRLVEALLEGN